MRTSFGFSSIGEKCIDIRSVMPSRRECHQCSTPSSDPHQTLILILLQAGGGSWADTAVDTCGWCFDAAQNGASQNVWGKRWSCFNKASNFSARLSTDIEVRLTTAHMHAAYMAEFVPAVQVGASHRRWSSLPNSSQRSDKHAWWLCGRARHDWKTIRCEHTSRYA